jgi:polygalacturonase
LALAQNAGAAAGASFYDVKRFGAAGDGRRVDTAAIQKAIDTCAASGGGKVVVPAGHYLTGPIFLRSRIQLELEAGSVLLGSTNFADYPAIDGRWEGIERKVYASLLTGRDLEQVAITGRGTLDGQGAAWWAAHRKSSALRRQAGLEGREPENPPEAPLRWPRPRLINLYHCTNVVIRDITLHNSPSWNIHPVYCEHVTLDNLTIVAPPDSPNTDAVDPDSCRDVRISNCFCDVGDDCIVIKSGYNEDGRRVGVPCENVLVNNCTFAHGHGGVVIGSEMSGSVRNVTVANCIFDGTQRGLRVKTALGRGGVIEHFRAANLVMRNITDTAFSITAAYGEGAQSSSSALPREAIPAMRHIHWSDISVVNTKRVGDLSALAESPIEDFSLRNVQVSAATSGIRCEHARSVHFENIELNPESGPALEARNVTRLEVLGLMVPKANEGVPVIALQNASDVVLHGCSVLAGSGLFLDETGKENQNLTCEANRLAPGVKETRR